MTERAESLKRFVEQAQQGSTESFGELVKLTYRDNLKLAIKLVGNLEDAYDVLQDSYIRAFRSLKRFRGDASFQTWMFRIVSNCASSHQADLRKKNREKPLSEASDIDRSQEADRESMFRVTLKFDIDAELKKLPQKLRTVVVLRDIYGMAHSEIAQKLGISEATAKVRLHRARKRLAQALSWLSNQRGGEPPCDLVAVDDYLQDFEEGAGELPRAV